MSFKVNETGNPYNRYKISIGMRKTFEANSINELTLALEHYFEHGKHTKEENCPLCKE
jgi:hypothetical protein